MKKKIGACLKRSRCSFGEPKDLRGAVSTICGLCLLVALIGCLTPALAEDIQVGPGGVSTLTEAVETAQPGDTIHLSAGKYTQETESFPIVIDKPLTLAGEEGAVLESPPFTPLLRVEAPDVTVKNIDFRLLRWGIVGLADWLTVRDCAFTLYDDTYRVSSCGVWLAGAKNAVLQNNRFTGCGVCLAGPPLSESSKGKPVLTGLFEVGEDPAFFTSHTLKDNLVNGKPLYYFTGFDGLTVPADAGQVIVACSQNVNITGVDVSDTSMGLIVAYCDDVTVTGVTADGCGVFGSYFAYVNGAVMTDTTTTQTNHGLDFRASRQLLLQNCRAIDCDQGIFFSYVDDSRVIDCEVTGTGQGYFFAAGNHNTVLGCKAIDCENGMNVQKENDMLVINCTLTGNSVCALRLDASPSVAVNNSFLDNWVDVMAYGDAEVTLGNNTFEASRSCALYLRDIPYCRIVDNMFQNCGGSSVQCHGDMGGTHLDNNALDKPPEVF